MFVLGAIVIPLILLTSTIAIDVGRFINVTIFSSSGGSDGELCNFDEIGTCIAALAE